MDIDVAWSIYRVVSSLAIIGLLVLFLSVPAFRSQRAKNWILFSIAMSVYIAHNAGMYWVLLRNAPNATDLILNKCSQYFDHWFLYEFLVPCPANMTCFFTLGIITLITRGRWAQPIKWLATGVLFSALAELLPMIYTQRGADRHPLIWQEFGLTSNLFAHSLLLLGCLYMVAAGFIKIKLSNLLPVLLFCGACVLIARIPQWDALSHMDFRLDYVRPNDNKFLSDFLDDFGLLLKATMFAAISGIVSEFVFAKPNNRFYKNWTKDYWLKQ